MRVALLAVVVGTAALAQGGPPGELSPPPLVESEGGDPDLAWTEAEAERAGQRRPLIAAPDEPRPVAEVEAAEAGAPTGEELAESSRWGVVAVAGGEGTISGPGRFGGRVGLGARFALVERAGEGFQAVPAVGLVVGYDHASAARLFGEVRMELLAARAGALCQPGFTLYALSGVDVGLAGFVEGYVGAGLGWNWLPRGGGGLGALGGLAGLGGGAGAVAGLLIAIVALPVILAFTFAGRVELRYYPALATARAPSAVALTIGAGF